MLHESPDLPIEEIAPGHFRIVPGRRVICDWCGKEWTDSPVSGGIYGLMTKAICPDCAPRVLEAAEESGEIQYVKSRCPPNKSFADWVRDDLRETHPD